MVGTAALRKELGDAKVYMLNRSQAREGLKTELFNRGGDIRSLIEACESETGITAPILPALRPRRDTFTEQVSAAYTN